MQGWVILFGSLFCGGIVIVYSAADVADGAGV